MTEFKKLNDWMDCSLGIVESYSRIDPKKEMEQDPNRPFSLAARPDCLKKSNIASHYKLLRKLCQERLKALYVSVVFPMLPPATSHLSVNEMACRLFFWLLCQRLDLFQLQQQLAVSEIRTYLEKTCSAMTFTDEGVLLFQLRRSKDLLTQLHTTFVKQNLKIQRIPPPLATFFEAAEETTFPASLPTLKMVIQPSTLSSSSSSTELQNKNQNKVILESSEFQLDRIQDVFKSIRIMTSDKRSPTSLYRQYTVQQIALIQKVFACSLLFTDLFWNEMKFALKSETWLSKQGKTPLDYLEEKIQGLIFEQILFHQDGLFLSQEVNSTAQDQFLDALSNWLITFEHKCGDILDYRKYYQETAKELIDQFFERIKPVQGIQGVVSLENLLGAFPDLFQEYESKQDLASFECPSSFNVTEKQQKMKRASKKKLI
jgi:hypothetical protein